MVPDVLFICSYLIDLDPHGVLMVHKIDYTMKENYNLLFFIIIIDIKII